MEPQAVVQRQLDAYNARDLERFLAAFSEDVRLYRLPATEPALSGKADFGAFYARERFVHAGLRAELLARMVLGNKVVDHERIHGVGERAFEVIVAYEVVEGLVVRMWSLSPQ